MESKNNTKNISDKDEANTKCEIKQYLIFSDKQIEFIEAQQLKLNAEFTEEEKYLPFI